MTKEEVKRMYQDIPYDVFIEHKWKTDVVPIGEVPSAYVKFVTYGGWDKPVLIEINKLILDPTYDLILSIGQVVPHEVIGMSNHSKNILVGCGGTQTISASHMIGAIYGMERMMGKDHSPVRKILDYAWTHFLSSLPLQFVLTVTTAPFNITQTHGLYIGDTRAVLEAAIAKSQACNIDFLEQGINTCVVYLDPLEFKTTWLGNKAIYRTRMAIKDGGHLIIIAPGVKRFGEDLTIDSYIRKYGYSGTNHILEQLKSSDELQQNMAVAAHLIHSSSDGRFQITYATKYLTKAEVESVGFEYMDYESAIQAYPIHTFQPGYNTVQNTSIFYIPNPALGLWIDKQRFTKEME